MPLYEGLVLLRPTAKEKKDDEDVRETIVVPRGEFLADNEDEAKLRLMKLVPEEHMSKTRRLEVVVRPF